VLVLGPGEEVSTIDVSPVHLLWQEVNRKGFPGAGALLDWAISEEGLSNAAAILLFEEIFTTLSFLKLWLREFVDSLVVEGVISLFISGLVHNTLGPGVLWDSP